jgi:NAD-dependent SIR2 family protein deacetylase
MAMLLGGVQIPADLLTAWEEQRLVIFTGAGVSMSPPSSLPNFAGLAAEVASILQSPLNPEDDEWKDQLDTFMAVMNEDDGVDVHRLVQGIVTKEGSAPNANHNALARIASKFSTRVITTNYDLHLGSARTMTVRWTYSARLRCRLATTSRAWCTCTGRLRTTPIVWS